MHSGGLSVTLFRRDLKCNTVIVLLLFTTPRQRRVFRGVVSCLITMYTVCFIPVYYYHAYTRGVHLFPNAVRMMYRKCNALSAYVFCKSKRVGNLTVQSTVVGRWQEVRLICWTWGTVSSANIMGYRKRKKPTKKTNKTNSQNRLFILAEEKKMLYVSVYAFYSAVIEKRSWLLFVFLVFRNV